MRISVTAEAVESYPQQLFLQERLSAGAYA